MDKRSFLKSLSGKSSSSSSTVLSTTLTTLNPYLGEWTASQAVHLLSRTVFGTTSSMLATAVDEGLELTVERLFEEIDLPDPPIHYNYENDPFAPLGETWVFTPNSNIQGLVPARRRSLRAWQMGKFHEAGLNIREKMVLFWHEHFPISNINSPRMEYQYLDLLQRHATGNFKTLTEEMTVAPAMLIYLNGSDNTDESPNENYARELLELFTLGRGEAVGNGDYTNYTEQDVEEIARALTGWRAREIVDSQQLPVGTFVLNRHDTGTKQLSHRFDNVVIENEGAEEYKRVIDIIFQKTEAARFISRQLHIWFVGSDITEEVEFNIIEPMAQMIKDQGYEIKDALKALLKSEYFHMSSRKACLLSSPTDFIFKIFNTLDVTFPENVLVKYSLWIRIHEILTLLEMSILQIPSVAGWKAYYQAPQYYQFWINSVTLNLRDQFIQLIAEGVSAGDISIRIDYLGFIANLEEPLDPQKLIEELAQLMFVIDISQNQIDFLKEVLIPGLPDFEWTVEYSEYLADPDDPGKAAAVHSKLENLFTAMMRMPEFYLM